MKFYRNNTRRSNWIDLKRSSPVYRPSTNQKTQSATEGLGQAMLSWSPVSSVSRRRCCCLFSVEDLERNDGSPEKPYYMSKELKEILGKKNVKPDKED